MDLIFYRHPTPDTVPGLCYGRFDMDIGPAGPEEVAFACKTPPNVTQIISSPAKRALALATPLAAAAGSLLSTDARLCEMNMGRWEGLLWSQIDRTESDPWAEDALNRPTPGGEAFIDVIARVKSVLEGITQPTCIVAHAGPIRAARMILTGASFDDAFVEQVPYATPVTFKMI